MSKIAFFSIPAHGHTNPTIPVVSELVQRGHEVWYFSFMDFKEKIEHAGARFIPCDGYLPPISEEELDKKAGKDFAALIEMTVDTTISMDEKVSAELRAFAPDCIVSDSLCTWGKLFADKLDIPYICSTTSFAFNKHTVKLMKSGFKDIWNMVTGLPRINRKIKQLRGHGYQVDSFLSLIQNDNDTDTIVYTTKEFQPLSETFSDRFTFIGPSVDDASGIAAPEQKKRKTLFISLGTVLNKNQDFYRNCIKAFAETDMDVTMSVGAKTDIRSLGVIPGHITIESSVNQIAVLSQADAFITHCGMNSANESLYFGVPMVLFPQHSEQGMVADRVAELGAGIRLPGNRPEELKTAVTKILSEPRYRESASKLAESFRNAGGAAKAADIIIAKANKS